MASRIPFPYRLFFLYLDPLIALSGLYINLFDRDTAIRAFIPDSPRNIHHDNLFYQLAGSMAAFAFLQIVLLRYTADLYIWKILQAAILLADFAGITGHLDALREQERMTLGALRGEDWGTLGILGFVTIMRLVFIAGIGLGGQTKGKRA